MGSKIIPVSEMGDALCDEEIRALTLWETDTEIPAFKLGWCYRREHGHRLACPSAKLMSLAGKKFEPDPDWGQNERVAWERGWLAANAVYERCGGIE